MPEQFSLREVKGPKEKVIEAIAASNAPEEAKAYLTALVASRPYEGVVIDCHAHSAGEDVIQHLHIRKLY